MGQTQNDIKQMKLWKREKLIDEYLSHLDCLESTLITNEMWRDIVKTILDYKNANLQIALSSIMKHLSVVILAFTMMQLVMGFFASLDNLWSFTFMWGATMVAVAILMISFFVSEIEIGKMLKKNE